MRILITGITGFVGSHLAEYTLTLDGVEVCGTIRKRSRTENIEHLRGQVRLVECDLRDMTSVLGMLRKAKPDRIFHLAAQSFVPSSWKAPADTLTNNIIGQQNLFEATLALELDPLIQIACSSEEYGMVHEDEVPIPSTSSGRRKETNPLRPLSPYGVSKVAQDLMGYQYFQSYGLRVVRTRGFNHSGPRRGESFASSNFAKQIAEIETGLREPRVRVGNLQAVRDFTDARDMVRAYWLALEHAEPGEAYNICSGKGYTIRQVLDILLDASSVPIAVEQDPERMRPSDVELLVGDSTKFRQQTGWEPTISFEQTLCDTLNYWREQINHRPVSGGSRSPYNSESRGLTE